MTSHTLHEVFSLWLVEAEKLWPKSYRTRISQIAAVEAWATEARRFQGDKRQPIERLVDDAGPSQFAADRLTEVLRGTVSGELSNLYTFFAWAVRERYLRSAPERPKLPRGAQGVRVGPQRSKPVDITKAEALAMCAAMPEWTAKGGGAVRGPGNKKAIRVRDVFRLCWELALRPGIAQKISVPRHYVRGQDYVWISEDIDKIGLERRIALTKAAREILERCAPDEGPIFGVHELTHQIKRAAKLVLPPEKAKHFARYDFRHGRAVHALGTTGDLLGTQRLLGHEQATTTNRYIRTREEHTTRMIVALDAEDGASTMPGTQTSVCSQEATTMAATAKQGQKKNPEKDHSFSGPSSLHLPKCRTAQSFGDPRCAERQRPAQNDADSLADVTDLPADCQHARVTDLQRRFAITRAIEDAFDLFALHASAEELGVDVELAETVDGGES